jgi:hypothetical protein
MRKYYNLRDNTETHVNILQNVEQEANDATEILHSSLQDMEESPVTKNRSVQRKRFKTSPK